MTVNIPSAQSVRIGGQIFHVNVSQAQVDARNIDRERARQLSRETARRRRALEDRRNQIEQREENKRQAELAKRREKQREATERYQRAHIPQRRRFSSPVLDKAYSAPALATDVNLHSLSDTRFQSLRPRRPVVNQVVNEDKHQLRTVQSRVAFKDTFQKPPTQPHPPAYPRPETAVRPVSVRTAWSTESSPVVAVESAEPDMKEESSVDESDEIEEEENSTFIVETNAVEINRCSTPEIEQEIVLVPQPPECPKPTAVDPRNAKIMSKVKPGERTRETGKEKVDEGKPAEKVVTGILKRRVTKRIVSASGNRGIIAASIRDSLELMSHKPGDGQRSKTVRWEKLYYDDGSIAEFAADGKPKPIAGKTLRTKNSRRVAVKKPAQPGQKGNGEKPKGKRITKKKKTEIGSEVAMSAMAYRHSSYSVAPTPSAATFKTETPQFSPHDHNGQGEGMSRDGKAVQTSATTTTNQISSRIPMPPTVARPLTSRTQILRSKRIAQTTNPIRAPPKPHFRTDSNYVVNSNNQVNIHIGSVELSPNTELNRTPTENDITWLWDRVRTVLESQKPSKRPRSSTVIPKSSSRPQFAKSRPHSAHVNSSTAAFVLAEQLASRGVADQRIMNVIQPTPPPPPQTTLSLEEQQIEQSLQRLDDRLLHIQETVGYNGIAFRNRH